MEQCTNQELPFRIKTLEERLERHITANKDAHEKLYSRCEETEKAQAVMQANTENIDKRLSEIKSGQDAIGKKLEELRLAPGHKWNSLTTSIITVIGGAGVGVVIALLTQM